MNMNYKACNLVAILCSFTAIFCLTRSFHVQKTDPICRVLATQTIPVASKQVVLVQPLEGVKALLNACELRQGKWSSLWTTTIPAVIGKKGAASLGEKKEGDLKTPKGLYPIGPAFGSQPMALKMDYKYLDTQDKFIDDLHSKEYNTWVHGKTLAKSYETMLIPLYKMGAIVNYNMNPIIPGAGSAIFIHLWRSENQGTAGCIALSEPHLSALLYWLDKQKNPLIYIN